MASYMAKQRNAWKRVDSKSHKAHKHNPNTQSKIGAPFVLQCIYSKCMIPSAAAALKLSCSKLHDFDRAALSMRDISSSTPRWLPHLTSIIAVQFVRRCKNDKRLTLNFTTEKIERVHPTARSNLHSSAAAVPWWGRRGDQEEERDARHQKQRENFTHLLHGERHADAVLLYQHSPRAVVMATRMKLWEVALLSSGWSCKSVICLK